MPAACKLDPADPVCDLEMRVLDGREAVAMCADRLVQLGEQLERRARAVVVRKRSHGMTAEARQSGGFGSLAADVADHVRGSGSGRETIVEIPADLVGGTGGDVEAGDLDAARRRQPPWQQARLQGLGDLLLLIEQAGPRERVGDALGDAEKQRSLTARERLGVGEVERERAERPLDRPERERRPGRIVDLGPKRRERGICLVDRAGRAEQDHSTLAHRVSDRRLDADRKLAPDITQLSRRAASAGQAKH